MRRIALVVVVLAGAARAETFGGFSGVRDAYLVNADRVCEPLVVKDGAATGTPSCEKAAADAIAQLSVKAPIAQRGDKASFAASASGRVITVARAGGDAVATWEAPDAVTKIVEVYATQYGDRVAVAYATRRLGREVTDIVAFKVPSASTSTSTSTNKTTSTTSAPEDPKLKAAIDAARKSGKKPGWDAVVALDPDNAEAKYRLAALAVAKQRAQAIAALEELAKSTRADAIEWLVEARFDGAFAPVRADPKFRAAVGLDRKPTTTYERLMGFGGQWLQNGTSCDKAEVHLTATRERAFKIRVKTACEGHGYDIDFKGTWRIDGDDIVLVVPTKGKQVTAADEGHCKLEPAGDEDALHCSLGSGVEFTVLPTRR